MGPGRIESPIPKNIADSKGDQAKGTTSLWALNCDGVRDWVLLSSEQGKQLASCPGFSVKVMKATICFLFASLSRLVRRAAVICVS